MLPSGGPLSDLGGGNLYMKVTNQIFQKLDMVMDLFVECKDRMRSDKI